MSVGLAPASSGRRRWNSGGSLRHSHHEPVASTKGRNLIWVEPNLVAEIDYRGWTDHLGLRHASFKGLRDIKDAREIFSINSLHMRKLRAECLLRERIRPFPTSLEIRMNVSMRMLASS